ncbi:MAG: carbohydrate kinase family protein [Galactobacillus timonensis]|uniref:carbohydrate kinase family protein n=1 Tax=Galactobacillus timonensis TaxID=2041840 RepID=UPI002409CD89|nr:carbohydrate kinase family protein [Galactobacillus timonensis]MDD6600785.1 carbohydrate kinase family protein [Galactobacillus timonensis]
MKKTVLIADTELDLEMQVDHLPKGNEDMPAIRKSSARISGLGWWISNVFHVLDFPVEWLAMVGSGDYGDTVYETLKAANVSLPSRSEAVAGCTWTFMDGKGNVSGMSAPGAEYEVPVSRLRNIKAEDVRCSILAGTMLDGSTRDDVLSSLRKLKNLIFIPLGRGSVQEKGTLGVIFDAHPITILREEELSLITGEEKDLKAAANALSDRTHNAVLVTMNSGEVYIFDGSEGSVVSIGINPADDGSGAFETFCGAFAAARAAGLSIPGSVYFGRDFMQYAFRGQFSEADQKAVKDALVERIMSDHKKPKANLS